MKKGRCNAAAFFYAARDRHWKSAGLYMPASNLCAEEITLSIKDILRLPQAYPQGCAQKAGITSAIFHKASERNRRPFRQ
jgi:hypothetical protein